MQEVYSDAEIKEDSNPLLVCTQECMLFLKNKFVKIKNKKKLFSSFYFLFFLFLFFFLFFLFFSFFFFFCFSYLHLVHKMWKYLYYLDSFESLYHVLFLYFSIKRNYRKMLAFWKKNLPLFCFQIFGGVFFEQSFLCLRLSVLFNYKIKFLFFLNLFMVIINKT